MRRLKNPSCNFYGERLDKHGREIRYGSWSCIESYRLRYLIIKIDKKICEPLNPTRLVKIKMSSRCIGYSSPLEAMKGEKEKLIYVSCVSPKFQASNKSDCLITVDADPESITYSKVIHQLKVPFEGDELHHFGWNACSSCKSPSVQRNRLIVPGINSGRIYIIGIENLYKPHIVKIIPPEDLHEKCDASAPHTVHCLPSGDIMISCLGNANGDGKGTFILLEQETFNIKGTWQDEKESVALNYDFWYQPRHNILISTEFAAPKIFQPGFFLKDQQQGLYGKKLHLWNFSEKKYIDKIDLDDRGGHMPLEIRFLHNPDMAIGYVGCAFSSSVFCIFKESGKWKVEKVISIPPLMVSGWCLPVMPALITDILISLDDHYLFASNWFHGDIRQYDITNSLKPTLVGQINLGGNLTSDLHVDILGIYKEGQENPQKILENDPLLIQRLRPTIKQMPVRGGPQMLQLSLDGKRLYVTNSLLSSWDKQFYEENIAKGSMMYLIDVNIVDGGMVLNPDFLIDFGDIDNGPFLAHEMRFPGGDSTSDIWT